MARAESIRAFRVLTREWSETSGHLTPSLKRDFAHEIDSMDE
ncbi:hypothetical protein ABZX98_28100 [Streptomyces sp. NPDC002992]